MKNIKKIIKYGALLVLMTLTVLAGYLYTSGPSLPPETAAILERVLDQPLPELVQGEIGFAAVDGVRIWYERIPAKKAIKGQILLVMGIANDALGWPAVFLNALSEAGYEVIRYDHRGTGLSDWEMEGTYSLKEMADDGIAVLDALGITRAHVLGVSMGGMIAQEMAIHHEERILSLTSAMSSGFIEDLELPGISGQVAWELIKVSLKYGIWGSEKNLVKLHLASRLILMGEADYPLNIQAITEQVIYNKRRRRGYNAEASRQHQTAVRRSGNRFPLLEKCRVPTLLIHGELDPFIPVEHGRKCAAQMRNASYFELKRMGHDIPDALVDSLVGRMVIHFESH